MTIAVYRGRKATEQQQQQSLIGHFIFFFEYSKTWDLENKVKLSICAHLVKAH